MFTMLLLIGVILLGTIIMINLIVAIIITDIERLNRISKQQVLRNQVCGVYSEVKCLTFSSPLQAHHAVQTDALRGLVKCLYSKKVESPVTSRR